MNKVHKILLIRNDKLGDFMLAWPSFSLLKKQYPDTEITALVPPYTAPMAEQCPWIDKILIDEKEQSTVKDIQKLAEKIKQNNYDLSISLYSETRTSFALWIARVKTRIGPATKLAQIFLNKTLKQKRSQSIKPEFEYNLDLIRYFIETNGDAPVKLQKPPFLRFNQEEITKLKNAYMRDHNIEAGRKLIFIHAGSGGSAINLSLQQFAKLANDIHKSNTIHFVLTAGPGEFDTASSLSKLMQDTSHSIYHSTDGLINFSKLISICDLFISGSTGPLHIAGTLNVATAAFYPARRSATPRRWQTINEEKKRIFFTPEKYTGVKDMETIDISMCAAQINQLIAHLDQS